MRTHSFVLWRELLPFGQFGWFTPAPGETNEAPAECLDGVSCVQIPWWTGGLAVAERSAPTGWVRCSTASTELKAGREMTWRNYSPSACWASGRDVVVVRLVQYSSATGVHSAGTAPTTAAAKFLPLFFLFFFYVSGFMKQSSRWAIRSSKFTR